MVMLVRDPEDGEVVEQVPSENVLRQYEETLRRLEQRLRTDSPVTDPLDAQLVYPSGLPAPNLDSDGIARDNEPGQNESSLVGADSGALTQRAGPSGPVAGMGGLGGQFDLTV